MNDVIVVGSGATGTQAAQTLVERGARVLMLDGGFWNDAYDEATPPGDFIDIREGNPEQHRLFLGERFEGLPAPGVGTGAQLTPPRQFVSEAVERLLPIRSQTFAPLESLARGGLGAAWGLGCCVFSQTELRATGLDPATMHEAYQAVADRIGISGAADDAQPYTSDGLRNVQPAPPADPTAQLVLNAYARQRERIARTGFRMGRPALALLTREKDGRKPTAQRDLDFYSDRERAAWRPWIALERLRLAERFAYEGGLLVTSFKEEDGGVSVFALDVRTFERRTFRARLLVLAAGALGTARIVLRSGSARDARLPLLCNAYNYLPCIVPQRIGRSVPRKNSGFAQLAMFYDREAAGEGIAMGSIYSYRSLLLYRLLSQAPLAFKEAIPLMRALSSALLILGVHHPQRPGTGRSLRLEPLASSPTGDRLAVDYALDEDERAAIAATERAFARTMRWLGAYPFKRVTPPAGSSIHYAGTLPYSDVPKPHALARNGRVHGTAHVYAADGSGFTYLPAKGLTLTLMANAHAVANALEQ